MSQEISQKAKTIATENSDQSLLGMNGGYSVTIGLEIHAELKTRTKMFCDSKNDPHAGEPNSHICPVCMGHPGTLPVINETAVKHVLTVGAALGGEHALYTEFDRKNYFYPDIPKGYQISQYEYPLVRGGTLNGVAITRVHLEEDTARSLHDQGSGSVIDYNRAGVPLMELVTEPVIHDARAAGNFARELQLLLRTLQVSDANMEKGEMRVEANISVSKTSVLGTKVEVKNLNSFKSVESAIDYEVRRQIELLEKDEKVLQETRGWDENRGKTFSQRVKETSDDYRYFPDPDLPSLDISLIPEFSLSRITEELPVTPARKRELYGNIGLAREQIEVIISDLSVDRFFNEVLDFTKPNDTDFIKLAANYITTDILSLCSSQSGSFLFSAADPSSFASLMRMLAEQRITSRVAKDLLPEVLFEGKNPETIASERGLLQQNTKETLLPVVRALLSENQSVVGEYKSGKESVLQFLVGQGMKATKGSANPALLAELIRQEISSNQT